MRHFAVRDIMNGRELCHAGPAISVREACCLMAGRRCGSVLIIEDGRLVGIFTESDLVQRVLAPGRDPGSTTLAEVMTSDPDTIGGRESVDEAVRRMDECGYRHLPVVEGGTVIGIIALSDCSIEDLAGMYAELEARRTLAERAW